MSEENWKTPRKDTDGNFVTNMVENNQFWFKKGKATEISSWHSIDEYMPGEHLVLNELIEVKGVCVWDSDGLMNTFCDFKVTHWRPLKDE